MHRLFSQGTGEMVASTPLSRLWSLLILLVQEGFIGSLKRAYHARERLRAHSSQAAQHAGFIRPFGVGQHAPYFLGSSCPFFSTILSKTVKVPTGEAKG